MNKIEKYESEIAIGKEKIMKVVFYFKLCMQIRSNPYICPTTLETES